MIFAIKRSLILKYCYKYIYLWNNLQNYRFDDRRGGLILADFAYGLNVEIEDYEDCYCGNRRNGSSLGKDVEW
jgi:hypothetical protein